MALNNGELLCLSSTENNGWCVHMEITSDEGLTWERTDYLNDGKEIRAIQPTILVHSSNKLQIIIRCNSESLLTSWSSDFGRTWSEFEPIHLPSANSGIDAVTLKDYRHLLVYNHQTRTENWWEGRHTLNGAVSQNGID